MVKKDAPAILSLLENHPELLEEKYDKGSTGIMLIANSGIKPVLNRAIGLKQTFSFHEAIVAGKPPDRLEFLIPDSATAGNSHSEDGFTHPWPHSLII